MRRTTNRRPTRLTESGLRRIIRSVIRESLEDLPTAKNQVTIQWSYDDSQNKKAVSNILRAIAQQKDLRILGVSHADITSPSGLSNIVLQGMPYYEFPDDPVREISITYNIRSKSKGVDSSGLALMTFTLTPVKGSESRDIEVSHPIEVEIEASSGYVDIIRVECLD